MSDDLWIDINYLVPDYLKTERFEELANDDENPLTEAEALSIIAKKQSYIEGFLAQADVPLPIDPEDVPEDLKDALAWLVVFQFYSRTDSIPQPVILNKNRIDDPINGLLVAIAKGDYEVVIGGATSGASASTAFLLANKPLESSFESRIIPIFPWPGHYKD